MEQYVFKKQKNSIFATGAKIVGGLAISTAIAAFGFIGGVYVDEFITKVNGQEKCKSLIEKYIEEDVCILPEVVYINQAYDLKYSTGLELANSLRAQNIKCCKIGDNYYTENSQEIIVVTLKKAEEEKITYADKIASENQIIYTVPNGYIFENGKAYQKDNTIDIKIFINSAEDLNFQELFPEETVINVRKLHTESYNNIRYNDFILDVNDETIAVADYNPQNTYEATLKLVPKKW